MLYGVAVILWVICGISGSGDPAGAIFPTKAECEEVRKNGLPPGLTHVSECTPVTVKPTAKAVVKAQ